MQLESLEFASLFSYTPRPITDAQKYSKTFTLMLKGDEYSFNPPILMTEYVANMIRKEASRAFSEFFDSKPVLVPTPGSSLTQPGTLWVPQRLAAALHRRGLGLAVEECLKRERPVRKSAKSAASDRPTAREHYESMIVQKKLSDPREILLIDDVITRGATLLGAAERLAEAFPNTRIRAFAAIRTISNSSEFQNILSPCIGMIRLLGSQTSRWP